MYLFELLQNAVDDGAMHISFQAVRPRTSTSTGGLMFLHNGKSFYATDCLGLASVGLSTKSHDEQAKKIGFMGIGFKAVYKRYSKVTIFDDQWSFCFEQQQTSPGQTNIEPLHAFVLKPIWIDDRIALLKKLEQITNGNTNIVNSEREKWCHFYLERPNGGIEQVEKDMKLQLQAGPVPGPSLPLPSLDF